MSEPRKYSVGEIDQMRSSIERSYGSGSYDPKQRSAEIENRLRTYMQNGTEPEELRKMANDRSRAEIERQRAMQAHYAAAKRAAPPPRVLKTKEDVIDEWFETSVAQYAEASATASELFDGFSGHTLKRFANNHAPDGVNIRQRDMEAYLDRRGIKSRHAMFAKRYDGVQVIIHGNVRSGNYGT